MKHRSTWVALGLVFAVALTIVWSLTRFHATTVEQTKLDGSKRLEEPPAVAELRSPQGAIPGVSAPDGNGNEVRPTQVASSEAPAKRSEPRATGITLSGLVTDASGRKLHPDELLCSAASRSDSGACSRISVGRTQSTEFDEDGHYSISNLRPGTREISVHVPGYRPWGDRIRLQEGEHDRRLDIALQPESVLHVRIVIELQDPSAVPASLREIMGDQDSLATSSVRCAILREPPADASQGGSRIEVEHGLVGALARREEAGATGTWVVRESIELHADLPVFVALLVGDHMLAWKQVDSVQNDVEFRLSLAQLQSSLGGIRLRVVDEFGRPTCPQSCRVSRDAGLDSTALGRACAELSPPEFTTSNPGEVLLRGLHPGPIDLQLSLRGYARAQVETVVEPGLERDLGEIRLERSLFIRGNVLDRDGRPADAEVLCEAVHGSSTSPLFVFPDECRTDSRGHFVIDCVGRGKYVLLTATNGFGSKSLPMLVSTESGSLDGIVIRVFPTVSVVVRLEDPPHTGIEVTVEDPQGLPVTSMQAIVEKGRTFAMFELPPGEFTVRASARGETIGSAALSVGSEPVRISLKAR